MGTQTNFAELTEGYFELAPFSLTSPECYGIIAALCEETGEIPVRDRRRETHFGGCLTRCRRRGMGHWIIREGRPPLRQVERPEQQTPAMGRGSDPQRNTI